MLEEALSRTLERGAADGSFRRDLDTRLACRLLRDAIWGTASWHEPGAGPGQDHGELARGYLTLLLDGLTPRV